MSEVKDSRLNVYLRLRSPAKDANSLQPSMWKQHTTIAQGIKEYDLPQVRDQRPLVPVRGVGTSQFIDPDVSISREITNEKVMEADSMYEMAEAESVKPSLKIAEDGNKAMRTPMVHLESAIVTQKKPKLVTERLTSNDSPVRTEMTIPFTEGDVLVDMKYLTAHSGLSDKWFYALIKSGRFPKPIKLGRSSRWRKSDYFQWLEDKERQRKSKP